MNKIVYLLCLIVLFSSCISEDKENIDTKSIKTVGYSSGIKWLAHWKGEGKKEALINELALDFSFLNQDVDLSVDFPDKMLNFPPPSKEFELICDSIANMVQQNKWPYDIMLCDPYRYAQVGVLLKDPDWGNKWLVDFKNEKWFIDAHKENFFQTDVYTKPYNGIAPGAYIEGVANILYCSSTVESLLGIKVKRFDMTMNDFIGYAKAANDYNQTHNDKITFFSMQRYNAADILFSFLSMSALSKDKSENRAESVAVLEQVYDALAKLAQYNSLFQSIPVMKDKNDKDLFDTKVLFEFYPTWINLFWQKTNPQGEKKMFPCELPSIDNKQATHYSGQYSAVFVIPKNARNKEAAIRLMKFIASSETASKWMKYSKSPSGLRTRINLSELGKDDYDLLFQHIKMKYNDKLWEDNINEVLFNSKKTIDFNVTNVMNGKMTPAEALRITLKQI